MRLYLTNTANTRVFNVALPGARMKLVGGDSGRVEREEFVDEVILAPSERAVVDVLLRRAGRADAGAPDAGADLPAGHDHRERRAGRAVARRASSRSCAATPRWSPSASGSRRWLAAARTRRSRSSPRWTSAPRRNGAVALRLPDAPGGHRRRARPLPEVRHDAARHWTGHSSRRRPHGPHACWQRPSAGPPCRAPRHRTSRRSRGQGTRFVVLEAADQLGHSWPTRARKR